MNLANLTITQAHQGLKKKEFSAIGLCQDYLNREINDKNTDLIFYFL